MISRALSHTCPQPGLASGLAKILLTQRLHLTHSFSIAGVYHKACFVCEVCKCKLNAAILVSAMIPISKFATTVSCPSAPATSDDTIFPFGQPQREKDGSTFCNRCVNKAGAMSECASASRTGGAFLPAG